MRISPPDYGSADRFDVRFVASDLEAEAGIVARIPDEPAIGEDGGPFFDTVPTEHQCGQSTDFGTMVYDLAPGVPDDPNSTSCGVRSDTWDEGRILKGLMTPAGHNSFYC